MSCCIICRSNRISKYVFLLFSHFQSVLFKLLFSDVTTIITSHATWKNFTFYSFIVFTHSQHTRQIILTAKQQVKSSTVRHTAYSHTASHPAKRTERPIMQPSTRSIQATYKQSLLHYGPHTHRPRNAGAVQGPPCHWEGKNTTLGLPYCCFLRGWQTKLSYASAIVAEL